jgi:hypothetical protein
MLGNRVIVTLRGVLLENPPAERARVANQRIAAAVKAAEISRWPSSLRTRAGFSRSAARVFMVTPGDLDEAAGQTLDAAASDVAKRLDTAVREVQRRRASPPFSWRSH